MSWRYAEARVYEPGGSTVPGPRTSGAYADIPGFNLLKQLIGDHLIKAYLFWQNDKLHSYFFLPQGKLVSFKKT